MINIEDKNYQPSIEEIKEYVDLPLFNEIFTYMDTEYNALVKTEYSGDKVLLGWNVKFKKAGKTLCTVYPRKGHFYLLVIVGNKEKEQTEALMDDLSDGFKSIYTNTKEGIGQRWLLFDFNKKNDVYEDVLKIVRIRRGGVKKA